MTLSIITLIIHYHYSMLSVDVLSVVMLSVVMLSVAMLSVAMLSVMASHLEDIFE